MHMSPNIEKMNPQYAVGGWSDDTRKWWSKPKNSKPKSKDRRLRRKNRQSYEGQWQ